MVELAVYDMVSTYNSALNGSQNMVPNLGSYALFSD